GHRARQWARLFAPDHDEPLRPLPHHQRRGNWPRLADQPADRRESRRHDRSVRLGSRGALHRRPPRGRVNIVIERETRPRILIVDDEPNLRKVLGALLEQAGYEVHAEPDGASALARVRALPAGTFDAVVSDLRMPNMDGMTLLRHLNR